MDDAQRHAIMASAADFWRHGKEGVPETAYRIKTLLPEMKEQHRLDAFTTGEYIPILGARNLDKIRWEITAAEMIASNLTSEPAFRK